MSREEGPDNRPSERQDADSDEGCSNRVRNRAPDAASDPRLTAMIEAWADLPEAVRAGIAAMVAAARKG